MRPERIAPTPGQESVWDYPRPPAVVACASRVRVVHRGLTIADTRVAIRVLETSQPPAFYIPRADTAQKWIVASDGRSLCEWKGLATYWSLVMDDTTVTDAAWSYEHPTRGFELIAGHLAFYAQRVDECWVDDERVVASPGSFYGGWITSKVVGPFKGDPGTEHW